MPSAPAPELRTRYFLRIGRRPVAPSQESIVLGRDPNAGLVIADSMVSRRHACIEVRDGGLVLRDLGSRNGTQLNGVAIGREHVLQHGDAVKVGMQTLTVGLFEDGCTLPSDLVRTPAIACAVCGEGYARSLSKCPGCGQPAGLRPIAASMRPKTFAETARAPWTLDMLAEMLGRAVLAGAATEVERLLREIAFLIDAPPNSGRPPAGSVVLVVEEAVEWLGKQGKQGNWADWLPSFKERRPAND